MKIEVYTVSPDGRFSRSWHFNRGMSALGKAKFLQANNKSSHCIVLRHKTSGFTRYWFGLA
jgi:hypothetical protein